MNIKDLYKVFLRSSGVTTDSRNAASGKIFFALRGADFDGHDYVGQALEKGCILAVIDNADFAIPDRTMVVDDVLLALQLLGCYHRQSFNIPVLAITGSNGKTTTKELIREVLSSRYRTIATRGNFNNHIGVPLTLLDINDSHEIAVIEMGANHIGEIDRLCNIAMPDHGLITNIGSAHLEGFGSLEGVRKAKSELYAYIRKTGGKAFVNTLRQDLAEISKEMGLDAISFGSGEENFVSGNLLSSGNHLEVEIKTRKYSDPFCLKTRLTGSYNFENILAAACAGIYFGIEPGQIKDAVESYLPENNRSQVIVTSRNKILLDAYNANPDSMKAAIENFTSLSGENKTVILGDMLELGKYTEAEHEKIVNILKGSDNLDVILVGSIFYHLPEARHFSRFRDSGHLIEWLEENAPENRFILIKGSRRLQLENCIPKL
jgi:UDP-N-acetylmuramoyl-tripeptide--D-alanyl-D-alanine ligase